MLTQHIPLSIGAKRDFLHEELLLPLVPQRPSVVPAQAGADGVRPGGGHQDHRGCGQQEQGQDSVNLGEFATARFY